MRLFVDTSVWSLALRRDSPPALPEVRLLTRALQSGDLVFTTGIILQELLQGFAGPRARDGILGRFSALPFLVPERADHVEASTLRNACRQRGIQVGTIDALVAALCLRYDLHLLTTDADFQRMAEVLPLTVWTDRDG
jgi:hypothetical protein